MFINVFEISFQTSLVRWDTVCYITANPLVIDTDTDTDTILVRKRRVYRCHSIATSLVTKRAILTHHQQ